jgi:hypothetical protein
VGDVGGGTRQEQLALGETPNLAARLQGIAAPNTLVISATTLQLLGGFFVFQPLGTPLLKGFAQPLAVYRVLYESMSRSRMEAAGSTGWTPLVGREQEIGLLRERWAQVKEGVGQVVLLSGEAGIGKSRLVQVLQEHVAAEPQTWLTPCQCSPYHQNTALYPMIDLLERVVLRFEREESPQQKLRKLEGFLAQYGLPVAEAVPLFASLLSLPLTADYAPLSVPPEQQKQQTLQAQPFQHGLFACAQLSSRLQLGRVPVACGYSHRLHNGRWLHACKVCVHGLSSPKQTAPEERGRAGDPTCPNTRNCMAQASARSRPLGRDVRRGRAVSSR